MAESSQTTPPAAVDPAAEMRRIRNQIRGQQTVTKLSQRAERGGTAARMRLRHDLQIARRTRQVKELPFESPTPVIGGLISGFRTLWNSVACKWHVRRILGQQNEYNRVVYELLSQMAGQIEALHVALQEQDALIIELEERLAESQRAASDGTTPTINECQD